MKSEQIKEITDRATEELVAALGSGRSGPLAGYLKAIGRFHRCSLHNVLLIRYPSAVCPGGTNVVLFDPDIADVTGVRLARITELTLEYEVEETAAHGTHAGESAEMAGPEAGASS